MRIPLLAGNWKMNTTLDEAVALVLGMRNRLARIEGVEKVLCPPFISLAAVRGLLSGTSIKLGAQNMHYEERGAYTGEVSPGMLSPLCQFVILGHSERRQYFGETDDIVGRKVRAAMGTGLNPILCVGESPEENERGKTEEVIARQVRLALGDLPSIDSLTIAYEPVWAIGTGRAATGKAAGSTNGLIRGVLGELYGNAAAQRVRILYGGSVTPQNIPEFAQEQEIDGALVGGASLKADDFVSIVEQTARIKGVWREG